MRLPTLHATAAAGALVLVAVAARAPRIFVARAASSPAPAASPSPYCSAIPLPVAPDVLPLGMSAGGDLVRKERAAPCRPLVVHTSRGAALRLAVVATEPLRERGLMHVPFVPAGEGMLFAFSGGDQERGFWMKDTIAPLDMIWVRSNGTISYVAANVPATKPGTPDDQVERRLGTGRYVIELAAGEAARLGLSAGGRLPIPSIAAE